MKYCSHCGDKIEEGIRFCGSCGGLLQIFDVGEEAGNNPPSPTEEDARINPDQVTGQKTFTTQFVIIAFNVVVDIWALTTGDMMLFAFFVALTAFWIGQTVLMMKTDITVSNTGVQGHSRSNIFNISPFSLSYEEITGVVANGDKVVLTTASNTFQVHASNSEEVSGAVSLHLDKLKR